MAVPQKFMLRVIIAPEVAVKLTLTERPHSVEDLIKTLQEKCRPRLDYEFSIHYEDPDFDGQLCCLVDIEDLPEKGTLQVVRSEADNVSFESYDTEILPSTPFSNRLKTWPDTFNVPNFSYEVEHLLQEGNAAYEQSGRTITLTRSQKSSILESMATAIMNYKPFPTEKNIGMAAEALVTAHPCLKEKASESGWYGWKWALQYKMGNFRSKLARAGCLEVAVNSGRRSHNNPDKDHPHQNIKKARRAEINYLPNFPKGEDATTLENVRLQLMQEVERSEKNLLLIDKLMQMTFALRRLEIVKENPMIGDFLNRWPALRIDSQICAEFHRITNINLRNQFYSGLDIHTPRLLNLIRQKAARTGKFSETLRAMMNLYDQQHELHADTKRTLILHGLPLYLREEEPQFFRVWNIEESPEPEISNTAVCVLTIINENSSSPMHFSPVSAAVIVEDQIVLGEINTFADAFVLLFGLVYVVHLDYPKKLVHTFTFIQKEVMGLEDGKPLKPCLNRLKNDLLLIE
ncbi:hypothetical protein DNTS_011833 [Danionella cerebrum]|uniref:PB1 domain-containing protein n=1 Tax=Danionella cerebrum TaxID=2873325 RepID=A0A553RPI9_9TELE|nr:hypothetical protein DNTS_011833 [Danionella translucida]